VASRVGLSRQSMQSGQSVSFGFDANVLCHEMVPEWLSSPGLGADKLARLYEHSRKRRVDEMSLSGAAYRRRVALDGSLRWRIHRARVYSTKWLGGGANSFNLTRKLRAAARCGPRRRERRVADPDAVIDQRPVSTRSVTNRITDTGLVEVSATTMAACGR
jgi:hypothetical protein